MKKIILLISLVLFLLNKAEAQFTFFFDSLNNNTSNWVLNTGTGSNQWVWNNVYQGDTCKFMGLPLFTVPNTDSQPAAIVGAPFSKYLHIKATTSGNCTMPFPPSNCNFDAAQVTSQEIVLANPISTMGINVVELRFWWLCNGAPGMAYGRVFYSLSGGAVWAQLGNDLESQSTWTQAILSGGNLSNQPNLLLKFVFECNGMAGNDPAFAIDDIELINPTPITNLHAPVAVNDYLTLPCNSLDSINCLLNDFDLDIGQPLSLTILDNANHGWGTNVNGTIIYSPNPNYGGPDTIVYVITDVPYPIKHDTAFLIISVTGCVNTIPIANYDLLSLPCNTISSVNIVANDVDPDTGQVQTAQIINFPQHGTASISGGVLTYTPLLGFSGPDTIIYKYCDNAAQPACDTAIVLINVTGFCGQPVISFIPTAHYVCLGSTVTFYDATLNNPLTWNWNFGSGLPSTANTQGPHTVTFNTPGPVVVTLDCSNGLGAGIQYVDTIYVVNGLPTAAYNYSPQSICPGQTITFVDNSLNYPNSWSWNFGLNALPATANTKGPHQVVFNNPGLQTVTLTVVNACGYSAPLTQTFTILDPPPQAFFTASANTVCVGNTISFNDISNGSISYWNWNFGSGAVPQSATVANPGAVLFNVAGYFPIYLSVSNSCGTTTDTQMVFIDPCVPPIADFTVSDTVFCEGTCIDFFDQSINFPSAWVWIFNGGNPATSSEKNPTGICYPNSGIFSVELISSSKWGNSPMLVRNAKIKVLPSPPLKAGNDTSVYQNTYAQLTATGGTNYHWSPATYLTDTDVASPLSRPLEPIQYIVFTIDTNGCSSSDTVNITIDQSSTEVVIPSAFSPNNDGYNDVLHPLGKNLEFIVWRVFDRWGNLAFEGKTLDSGWNGTMNGKPANAGSYMWDATYKSNGKAEIKKKTGTVTLLR